jgi:hypothetical protein
MADKSEHASNTTAASWLLRYPGMVFEKMELIWSGLSGRGRILKRRPLAADLKPAAPRASSDDARLFKTEILASAEA